MADSEIQLRQLEQIKARFEVLHAAANKGKLQCILCKGCGNIASLSMFLLDKKYNVMLKLPETKVRSGFYGLCRRCAELPDADEQAEKKLMRDWGVSLPGIEAYFTMGLGKTGLTRSARSSF